MSSPALQLSTQQWPVVLDALHGVELNADTRMALIQSGLTDADGRSLTSVATTNLSGVSRAVAVISVRTARPEQVADLDVFLAPYTSTCVERLADQLLISAVQTSIVPIQVVRQLGIGPRPGTGPGPGTAQPFTVGPALALALITGDHPGLMTAITEAASSAATNNPEVAAALAEGDWRASVIDVTVDDELVAGLMLLDTRAALFAFAPGADEASVLTPTTPATLWPRLASLTTLTAEGHLATTSGTPA